MQINPRVQKFRSGTANWAGVDTFVKSGLTDQLARTAEAVGSVGDCGRVIALSAVIACDLNARVILAALQQSLPADAVTSTHSQRRGCCLFALHDNPAIPV